MYLKRRHWTRGICTVHGLYYLATGIWPLVSVQTFQAVTGKKTDNLPTGAEIDHWLLNTVSVLIIAIGASLLTASWRHNITAEVFVLAIASAIGLIGIDAVYVWRGVIPPVYLLDAGAEVILLILWMFILPFTDLRSGKS